ncbi:MAG TPA: hypothetical protein VG318_08875 [Actinomycetota bacterium]|nr:hypothetical protein [Actinomycetota bacterium]
MIPATVAVVLALAAPAPVSGPRALDRHVCLVSHDCSRRPVICLTARPGECAVTPEICLVDVCDGHGLSLPRR